MFLSRIKFQKTTHLTFLLRSPQNLHAAVAEAFDSSPRYRMDETREGYVMWVVSEKEPVSPFSLPGSFDTRPYEPIMAALKEGDTVSFRIKASTVRSESPNGSSGRSRKVACKNDEEASSWITSRLNQRGFSTDSVRVVTMNQEQFKHGKDVIVSPWSLFTGTVTITDIDAARSALREGIGRHRAYGMGLLTLAK